jgi:CheY-like chemotaxis protein
MAVAADGVADDMSQNGGSLILVVDDDDEIREALGDVLQDEGFRVVGMRDGREALEYLRNGTRPCAILLDLWMPGMDGWQLRYELEREPSLAEIPIIVVTAARGQRREELRVAEVLTKPLRLEQLLEVLSTCCGRAAAS